MRFDICTLFPKAFDSYFATSIVKRAQEKKHITIRVHDLRTWTQDKHRTADDRPYGGGAGMVLKAEPILRAVRSLKKARKQKNKKTRIIVFSAKGKQFTQAMAKRWARGDGRMIFISGRYEGIDERVRTVLHAEEVSIGPYVTTDGDVAAMVVISAITRLLPGVIRSESLHEESFTHATREYPHYTRPEVFLWKGKQYRVPKVLLSGDHTTIAAWRKRHS